MTITALGNGADSLPSPNLSLWRGAGIEREAEFAIERVELVAGKTLRYFPRDPQELCRAFEHERLTLGWAVDECCHFIPS